MNKEQYADELDEWLKENYKEPTEKEIKQMQEQETKRKITFHCKPCYNFQSIEFDFEVETAEDYKKMFSTYEAIINSLIEISPEQPDKAKKQAVNLATDKQKEIMNKFKIRYTSSTTREEAQKLIQNSVNNMK